jgi:hypothetical protein
LRSVICPYEPSSGKKLKAFPGTLKNHKTARANQKTANTANIEQKTILISRHQPTETTNTKNILVSPIAGIEVYMTQNTGSTS